MEDRTCNIEGCGKTARARGWCGTHYQRWKRLGTPLPDTPRLRERGCSVEGCESTGRIIRGWCLMHYRRATRNGDPHVSRFDQSRSTLSLEETFLVARGEPTSTGCIEWQGSINGNGYGEIVRDGKSSYMHRYAYEREHGPIPAGHVIRHTCDNPPCVNPDHLIPGTHHDNAMDAYKRLRHKRGTAHRSAKMDDEVVRELRRLREAGMSYASLGERFGIAASSARKIALRESWRQVT